MFLTDMRLDCTLVILTSVVTEDFTTVSQNWSGNVSAIKRWRALLTAIMGFTVPRLKCVSKLSSNLHISMALGIFMLNHILCHIPYQRIYIFINFTA